MEQTYERNVDRYPEARRTMNHAYEAMVEAAQVLEDSDLSQAQKRELADIIAENAAHLSELARQVKNR